MIKGVGALKAKIQLTYEQANKKARAIMLQGFSNIIIESPVDTGRYRNNWIFSSGKLDSTEYGTSEEIKDNPSVALNRLAQDVPLILRDGMYYYQNNMSYANFLEYEYPEHRGLVRRQLEQIRIRLPK